MTELAQSGEAVDCSCRVRWLDEFSFLHVQCCGFHLFDEKHSAARFFASRRVQSHHVVQGTVTDNSEARLRCAVCFFSVSSACDSCRNFEAISASSCDRWIKRLDQHCSARCCWSFESIEHDFEAIVRIFPQILEVAKYDSLIMVGKIVQYMDHRLI